ncbi:uncharacterized protein LOC106171396 [Lingula anatina]|uniref:Uncharacterized protein LOC106171396 n=1 Tax=Lingula anatina TaxID=7574 RepID=A0A1S3J9V5_LINAN|nr:uncharacterized protein LOC106171396 [Lingula anatina]|eukprot:XP_013407187.1 uncharacterized protein LOC106171396 [Lingula anatina]
MQPITVLVTGANRGIGLELVRQIVARQNPPKHVFATCRDPDRAKDLQALAKDTPSIEIVKLDVTDYATLRNTVVPHVQSKVGDLGLNLLINNAGLLLRHDLSTVTPEAMREVYEVNTIAPVMITQAFLPLLKAASARATGGLSCSRAAVINITSKVGSCADNQSGKHYPYRCSKAALNIATVSMSVDLKGDGILAAVLHPGWVKTQMGGSNAIHELSDSVKGMLDVMDRLTENETGKFFEWKGNEIPW